MYVTGDFTAGGNGLVNWDSGIPTRMKLYMRGNNREVLIQDNAKVAADVQNPSGRMKVVSNGTEFHGTYYGRDFLADDRAKIRLDVRFGQGGSQETGGTFTYRVIWQDEL
jgi:hypothetical protein